MLVEERLQGSKGGLFGVLIVVGCSDVKLSLWLGARCLGSRAKGNLSRFGLFGGSGI